MAYGGERLRQCEGSKEKGAIYIPQQRVGNGGHIAAKGYTFQGTAPKGRIVKIVGKTVGGTVAGQEFDSGKLRAAGKGVTPYRGDPCRNGNGGEGVAVAQGAVTYALCGL